MGAGLLAEVLTLLVVLQAPIKEVAVKTDKAVKTLRYVTLVMINPNLFSPAAYQLLLWSAVIENKG